MCHIIINVRVHNYVFFFFFALRENARRVCLLFIIKVLGKNIEIIREVIKSGGDPCTCRDVVCFSMCTKYLHCDLRAVI